MSYEQRAWAMLSDHLSETLELEGKEKRKLIEHSGRVLNICKHLAEDLDIECDGPLLECAAILHDIAKFDEDGDKDEDHNISADDVIEEYRESLPSEIKYGALIDVIECHRGDFDPRKNNFTEAAVLRMADKIDKFNKYPDDAVSNLKDCADSLKKISKYAKEKRCNIPPSYVKYLLVYIVNLM